MLIAACSAAIFGPMQTSLHIENLVAQLKSEAIGARVVSTEFYKKERAAYIFLKREKTRLGLGSVFHPAGYGVFLVPASKVKIETREKPWPIFELTDTTLEKVTQVECDRIIYLDFRSQDGVTRVVIEALGPNGNLWWLDESGVIKATLRKRSYESGSSYAPVPLPDKIDPRQAAERLESAHAENPDLSPNLLLEKQILGYNRTLARETVHRVGLDGPDREIADAAAIGSEIKRTADKFLSDGKAYLYEFPSGLEAYPFKIKSTSLEPSKFKNLSLAVQELCRLRKSGKKDDDEQKRVTDAVKRAVKRLKSRLTKVEQDFEKAADFDKYRQITELLQIHFAEIKRGDEEIQLENVYADPPTPLVVKLDPALSPHQNVEAYAKKYRKGRDGHELLERRLEVSRQELAALEEIASQLTVDYEASLERYREEIDSLLPREGEKREAQVRLPYREYALSTGVRLFVGRDGADNDRTTFEFAKPYELWFHTQQCPGSHVVIKYPNKSFQPSKLEIEEAAAIAAFHSKARNDTLVPVIYTERRYVRKPRKAKPGLVTVEREKSVMVAPKAPDKSEK